MHSFLAIDARALYAKQHHNVNALWRCALLLTMHTQSTLCKAAKPVKAHLGDVHSLLAMDARALYAKQGSQVE